MKPKLAYINEDSFLDTDLTVLAGLAVSYDVIWMPVITADYQGYPESYLDSFASDNNLTLRIVHTSLRKRSLRNIGFYSGLARQIKRDGCNLVFTAINNPYWALASALVLKAPVIQGFHDYVQHSGFNQRRALQFSANLTACFRKHFLFYSREQYEQFLKHHPKAHAICAGMATVDYGRPTVSTQPIDDGVKILFFGRIDSYKGLDLLITSLESIYSSGNRRISLTIRGRGDFWAECEPLIVHRECFDAEIRFVENREIPDLFASHHFLVLPYRDTTQSGPMMIALHYGVPVIVPGLPAFLEHCNSDNSIIYENGRLSDALRKCIELGQSDYDSIRSKWSEEKDSCPAEGIVRNYICFFNGILNGAKTDAV